MAVTVAVAVVTPAVLTIGAEPASAAEASLGAPSGVATQAIAGGADPLPPNDELNNARGPRNVNGTEMRSRGYNSCLNPVTHPRSLNVYTSNECFSSGSYNGYIESIAQARFIQYLNGFVTGSFDTFPVPAPIQWELRLPSGTRPDVVTVGPNWSTPSTNGVGVTEIKLATNGGAAAALTQMDGYLAEMHAMGWSSAAPDTFAVGYYDEFDVLYRCPTPGGGSYFVSDNYVAAGAGPGVVVVAQLSEQGCKEGQNREQYRNTKAEEIPGVEPVPLSAPSATPATPSDDDQNRINWAAVAAGAAVAATGADAAVRYYAERAAVRTAGQAAFEDLKHSICLGPVNLATRTRESVSPTALECEQVASRAELLAFLEVAGLEFTAEELQAAGISEAEALSVGLTVSPALVRADPRLTSLDGLNYDFHAVGEYTLLKHQASELEIQMRTVPAEP